MMDGNGDENYDKEPDHDMQKFTEDAQLVDHFHEKFPELSWAYTYDSKRLNWIMSDPALVGAIEIIGYLGTPQRSVFGSRICIHRL